MICHLVFSKTLVNTIISNRWRLINTSPNVHLSLVGYNLNQMFLRLVRITSVLQYMRILADQSSYLTVRRRVRENEIQWIFCSRFSPISSR